MRRVHFFIMLAAVAALECGGRPALADTTNRGGGTAAVPAKAQAERLKKARVAAQKKRERHANRKGMPPHFSRTGATK